MAIADDLNAYAAAKGVTPRGEDAIGWWSKEIAAGRQSMAAYQAAIDANAAQNSGIAASLHKIMDDYGVVLNDPNLDTWWSNRIASGEQSLDSFTNAIRANAISQHPDLAPQINAGQTTKQAQAQNAANAPPPPTPVEAVPQSADAVLKSMLDQYGLGSLAGMAYDLQVHGAQQAEVLYKLRETNEWKQRFKGNEARKAKGETPLSEADYVSYEQQAASLLHNYGLPRGFYDSPDDFAGFIGGDVSISELNSRVTKASQLLYSDPPEVRQAAADLFGLDDGHLLAWALDPERALPTIQKTMDAARAAGTAKYTGFGGLTAEQALRVATLTGGADPTQEFGKLAGEKFLTDTQLAGEQGISRDDVIEAGFANNADAQAKISRRQRARQAAFDKGGQFATTSTGAIGIGNAS